MSMKWVACAVMAAISIGGAVALWSEPSGDQEHVEANLAKAFRAVGQPPIPRISCEPLSGDRWRCALVAARIGRRSIVVDGDHPEISWISYAPLRDG